MSDIPFTALCSVNAADSKTSILASKGGPFSSIVSTTRRMRSKMSLVKTLKNNQVLQTIAGNDQLIEGENDLLIMIVTLLMPNTSQYLGQNYIIFLLNKNYLIKSKIPKIECA